MFKIEKPAEGSWTAHYPELGTEPISYEDSISPEFYELEREAIFKRSWLNVGRVEQLHAQGQLLHQGARGREHVGRDRARHGRRGARVPQHLPAPREQAGVDRLPEGGVERQRPPVRVQVPRLEVRPRRRVRVRAAGRRVLRLRQGRLRPRAGALRRVGRVHLRQPRRRAEPDADGVPRADGHRDRGLPVRPDDRALLLPGRRSGATGSSSWTPSRSSTTHRFCTRSSRRRSSRCPSAGGRLRGSALRDRRPAPHGDDVRRAGLADAARDAQADGDRDAQRPVRPVGRSPTSSSAWARCPPASTRGTRSRGGSTRSRSGRTS